MKFELNKYYKHTSGQMINPVCIVDTTMFGKNTMLAETNDSVDFIAVGQDEGSAMNWKKSTKEEWMKNFSKG